MSFAILKRNFLISGAHLHDGSEYTGSYEKKVTVADMKKWHKVRINACVEAGVDGLAIETIPCLVIINDLFFRVIWFNSISITFSFRWKLEPSLISFLMNIPMLIFGYPFNARW